MDPDTCPSCGTSIPDLGANVETCQTCREEIVSCKACACVVKDCNCTAEWYDDVTEPEEEPITVEDLVDALDKGGEVE